MLKSYCWTSGLPGPSKWTKMPNSFRKCQTSWNRPMAVSFELLG